MWERGTQIVDAELGLWRTSPEWLVSQRCERKTLFLLWPTLHLLPFNYRQQHGQHKSWALKTFCLDNISLLSRCGGFGSRLWESLVYCKNLQTEERAKRHISSKILQDFCLCHRGCGRLRLLPRATYSVTHWGCGRLRLQSRATYSPAYWGWGKVRLLLSSTYNPTLAAETGQSKNPRGLKFGSTSVSLHFQVPCTWEWDFWTLILLTSEIFGLICMQI